MTDNEADAEVVIESDWLLERFDGDRPVIHEDAALVVSAGRVARIGGRTALRDALPDAPRAGGAGQVLVPGFVNAHHHVGATPLQLGSLDHPLELWFASRLALRDVDPYLDTLQSAFEMIESGVTTVQHLHSRAAGGLAGLEKASSAVLAAYGDIGLRVSYSMALRDQNRLVYEPDADFVARLPVSLRPAMEAYFAAFTVSLSDQVFFFESLLGHADGRVAVQLAPSNLHWLSDEALGSVADLSTRHAPGGDADAGLCMHAHIVETPYQAEYARRRTGGTALAHFDRFGLVGPALTVGHGVWLTDGDLDLIAERGACVCHNCSSNLRLKSGIAPVNRMLARGIPVAIGIDEAGINDDRDMLQEMRLVQRFHRPPGIDAPAPSSAQLLRMATEHGARTTPFGSRIGSLTPGSQADCVLFDWNRMTAPWQSPDVPVLDVLVQRAKAGAVREVRVAGEAIYRDGRHLKVDKDETMAELARFFARALTGEETARRGLARDVMPHVRAFYADYLPPLPADPRD